MAINAITAATGTLHVTSYDARKMIYAHSGPWPHRCVLNGGEDDFSISVNEENSLYYDLASGIVVFHGYVFSNDGVISREVTYASSGKYKKATVFIRAELTEQGYDTLTIMEAYSEEGETAGSVSYPDVLEPESSDYIIDDVESPAYHDIPIAHVLIYGNNISSVENLLPAWDNKQFYAPGDEIDLSYNIFSGYLAASGANVYFFIPFAKALSMISGASLSGAFTIRHADGGFIGSNSGQALSDLGTVTVSVYESGAYVRCVMNSASQLTNQAPLSVLASNGTKLIFS